MLDQIAHIIQMIKGAVDHFRGIRTVKYLIFDRHRHQIQELERSTKLIIFQHNNVRKFDLYMLNI
jgi:hypothetical protein